MSVSSMSKYDSAQIPKLTFDPLTNSNKVTLVSTDISIELSAADGDSVISKSMASSMILVSGQIVDISQANELMFASLDNITVNILLRLDNIDIPVYTAIPTNQVKDICLTTVKFIFTATNPVYLITK